ncbi:MAG: SUMF1/EgtB/PvdO family nonheme iron enzyme [Bacteroidota bacterium]|nr:SUMF1/EgtB/PvdO family nonheme iron enzyme [Bacteroidota bacterium]
MKKTIILIIIINIYISLAYSNGLDISNISIDQTNSTVSFVVNWQNSWNYTTGQPQNFDAVWIFVKFRDCSVGTAAQFTHGLVSTTISDHSLSTGVPILQFVNSDGVLNTIDAVPNNTGVLLKRITTGFFSNPISETIKLKITNLPAPGTTLDLRVFGIEMVYIPQESFYLGDNNTSNNQFRTSNVNNSPIYINGETGYSVYNGVSQISVPATYPQGYNAFFCMKYEITEQQYADFLNTMSSADYANRFPGNFNSNRNRLNNGGTYPNIYFTDRPYRAQNFLSWADISAYLDWACLCPISEFQYEKACRGSKQGYFPGEYSWGNSFKTAGNNFSGTEDGKETLLTGNCISGNTTFTGGDAGTGPARAGIFATSTVSTREQSGASYYGVMELTGNVFEWCVIATGTSTYSKQLWGDGTLAAGGTHNVANWPLAAASTDIIVRGGSWALTTDYFQVSYRRFSDQTAGVWNGALTTTVGGAFSTTLRTAVLGGRGIR